VDKVKIQTDITKVIHAYVRLVQEFPETFSRDQCLARFQESIGWLEKCVNEQPKVKLD
jgi:hypothetical protein